MMENGALMFKNRKRFPFCFDGKAGLGSVGAALGFLLWKLIEKLLDVSKIHQTKTGWVVVSNIFYFQPYLGK